MKRSLRLVLGFAAWIVCSSMGLTSELAAAVQESSWIGQTNSGRNVFGPYHRPLIVKNEYGTDDNALLVYKDKSVEMYVPDVTDKNGYMRLQELDSFGTFTTMLYMYGIKGEETTTYFASVDMRKKIIKVRIGSALSDPAVFTFATAPYAIKEALMNTTKIMQREIVLQGTQ